MFRQSPILALGLLLSIIPARVSAQDRLCDPGDENCRDILLDYISKETVGIDVAFWFMEDARYTAALAERWRAGVPVRVLIDPRANSTYPLNAQRLAELQSAGIPMRKRLTNDILHWKMMLFEGQNVVEFSGANYSADAWRPATQTDYENYTDEAIFFTSDTAITNSFRTKFDDHWIDTAGWADYANITGPLVRRYDIYPKAPSLNFPPTENYRTRAVTAYNAERRKIDVIMFRITDRGHTDAILAAVNRGIPVRLITEPEQYRNVTRMWHSWNVDRLYMGGVGIKHRAHAGLNHQKSVILYDQNGSAAGDQSMVIFGSSNWTTSSANAQVEHNMFTSKPDLVSWYINQFERKWNNTGGVVENVDFVPLPPDAPKNPAPATGATAVNTTVTLKWFGGPWAHLYDLYLDTNPNPSTLVAENLAEPGTKTETSTFSYSLPAALAPGTTYYWKVVGKTMALQTKTSAVWSFTTAGQAPPPPPTGTAEIVLYASKASKVGAWQVESDASAAGGAKIRNPNLGAAKIETASANPANYFEMTFYAEAGLGYHLWIRGRADSNSWANDSIFVQFDQATTSSGAPVWRIGTTDATWYSLENCNGCGVSGWGWQDNAYGINVPAPLVYFATGGLQKIRVQQREDGLAIDQIVLSHTKYLSGSPGALKNDAQILAESGGSGEPPPPPPPPPPPSGPEEIVLHPATNPSLVRAGAWALEADATAAEGFKLRHPNAGAAKILVASGNPANYFDVTFHALAGRPYRIWVRGKADGNYWGSDSVFVQFSGSVDANSAAMWRIGTTSASELSLEDCNGCGVSGWGWQDNGWASLGPVVYFAEDGPQTIRIQTREDGFAIDHLVLSSGTYLTRSPGTLKNDTTVLTKTQ